jgi:hypothetical protein
MRPLCVSAQPVIVTVTGRAKPPYPRTGNPRPLIRRKADRIEAALTLIEAGYEIAQKSSDKRMMIVIQNNGIKILR